MPKQKKSKDGFINECPPKRQKVRLEMSRFENSSDSPVRFSPSFQWTRIPKPDKVQSPVQRGGTPSGVRLHETSWKSQTVKGTSQWLTRTVTFDHADKSNPLSSKPVEKLRDDPAELGIMYGSQEERESTSDSDVRVATVRTDQRKKKRKRTDNETDWSDSKHETDDIGDLVQMLTPAYNDRERKKRIKIERVITTDLDPVVRNCRNMESKKRATARRLDTKSDTLITPNRQYKARKKAVEDGKDGNCRTDMFSSTDERDNEDKGVIYHINSVVTPVRYRQRMDSMDRVKWRGNTCGSRPATLPKDVFTAEAFRGDTADDSPTAKHGSQAKHGLIPSVLLKGRRENVATRMYSPFVGNEDKYERNSSFSPSICNESPKDRVVGSASSPLFKYNGYDERRVDYSGISPSAWCTPKAKGEGDISAVFSPSLWSEDGNVSSASKMSFGRRLNGARSRFSPVSWSEDKDERDAATESSPSVFGTDNLQSIERGENVRRTSLCFKENLEYEKFLIQGVELVGDSMLLRLFNQLTGSKPTRRSEPINSRIALTVSGQRLGQVLYKLQCLKTSDNLPTSKTVVVMLGTNDILKHTALPIMQHQLRSIVHLLSTKCKKIVVMTIPPIPLLDGPSGQLDRMKLLHYNQFIRMGVEGGRCSVIDPYPLFLEGAAVNRDLFESSMGYGMYMRPDWIHWNAKGMVMVHSKLCKAGIFC